MPTSMSTQIVVDDDLIEYELGSTVSTWKPFALAYTPPPDPPWFVRDSPRPASNSMFITPVKNDLGAKMALPVEPVPAQPTITYFALDKMARVSFFWWINLLDMSV